MSAATRSVYLEHKIDCHDWIYSSLSAADLLDDIGRTPSPETRAFLLDRMVRAALGLAGVPVWR